MEGSWDPSAEPPAAEATTGADEPTRLVALLSDPDPITAESAEADLIRLGAAGEDALLEPGRGIGAPDVPTRWHAVRVLGRLRGDRVERALCAALEDEDPVAREALEGLARAGGLVALSVLRSMPRRPALQRVPDLRAKQIERRLEDRRGLSERTTALMDRVIDTFEPSGSNGRRLLDTERVERALAQHLAALGLRPLPVRWVTNELLRTALTEDEWLERSFAGLGWHEKAMAGFLAAWEERQTTPQTMELAKDDPASERLEGLIDAANAAEMAAGRKTLKAGTKAGWAASESLDREKKAMNPLRAEGMGGVWTDFEAEECTHLAVERYFREQRGRPSQMMEAAQASAANPRHKATQAVFWSARRDFAASAGQPPGAMDRVIEVYRPLLDAVEAGLWLFWVTPTSVLAVAGPQPLPDLARRAMVECGGFTVQGAAELGLEVPSVPLDTEEEQAAALLADLLPRAVKAAAEHDAGRAKGLQDEVRTVGERSFDAGGDRRMYRVAYGARLQMKGAQLIARKTVEILEHHWDGIGTWTWRR